MGKRILSTHVGSLPRPDDIVDINHRRHDGAPDHGEAPDASAVADAVKEVVSRQREAGIDAVNDGEYGHSMGSRYDYGAWWTYLFPRLEGLELVEVATGSFDFRRAKPKEGGLMLASFRDRRDWTLFADAYHDPGSGCALPAPPSVMPVCRGPIAYKGTEEVRRDIANFKAALEASGLEDGFLNAVAPGSASRFPNEHYADDEELLYACADALREEYTAIIDAGLSLQLDDPCLADNWDQIVPEPSLEAYKRFTMIRVEALNYAIRDLPTDRIRAHFCWGSWHGPHVTDIPMADIVDVMLKIDVGAYSFEAANGRHEHEWRVWEDVKLPEGKKILPGVVSHSTNVVEHPELVAERIERFAKCVGAENVVASTDCGLGGRIHPQIAWAKLESLGRGAELAGDRTRVAVG